MKNYYKLRTTNYELFSGFTLVEMLIYTSILAVMLILLTNAFTGILSAQLSTESSSNIQQDVRFIFSRIAYDVTRADSITNPATIGTTTNTLAIVISGENYSYQIDGNNNVQLTNNSGTNMLNSFNTRISNFSFQRLGNTGGKNSIKVAFTITSRTNTQGTYESKSVTTTVGMR